MRILITGGAGFIGSNIACHLRSVRPAAEIVCMDNLYRKGSELNVARYPPLGIQFHRGDVRHPADFPAGPFDLLIECSAEPSVLAGSAGSPAYLFETNLVGAFQCLEQARSWQAKVIFLSTSRVYPVRRLESHPWQEEATRFAWLDEGVSGITARGVAEELRLEGRRSLYGFTKLACEQMIEEYRDTYGLSAVVNRCGVIAGPWQFGKVDQGIVAHWVMAHVFDRPLSYIGYGGQGKQVRDVLHVQDLCELVGEQITAFDVWDGWTGNVAGGLANSVSLLELTALCQEITGREIAINSDPQTRPNDLRLFIGDCSRLFERTSWRPSRSVRQVVADTLAWVTGQQQELRQLA
ncbi:MAG: NAD-dependent epimerase/dehydratase family protein [Prosthecobacter sp.]|uniref:NAD-dependent epimerase/dehydratase family protein n=1 Tax=Prosthecobacter sp. TaxID=1965333 RepID=UPI0038FDD2FD